jgi:hypothetical protein
MWLKNQIKLMLSDMWILAEKKPTVAFYNCLCSKIIYEAGVPVKDKHIHKWVRVSWSTFLRLSYSQVSRNMLEYLFETIISTGELE